MLRSDTFNPAIRVKQTPDGKFISYEIHNVFNLLETRIPFVQCRIFARDFLQHKCCTHMMS